LAESPLRPACKFLTESVVAYLTQIEKKVRDPLPQAMSQCVFLSADGGE
jgi:hypothetical protein